MTLFISYAVTFILIPVEIHQGSVRVVVCLEEAWLLFFLLFFMQHASDISGQWLKGMQSCLKQSF